MNWSGAQAGEGFEFHLLALALSVPLMLRGAGAWSLDGWLARTLPSWRDAVRTIARGAFAVKSGARSRSRA